MLVLLAKLWQLIVGRDYRMFFPEKWDFSRVHVWKQYGGNEGFISYYKDYRRSCKFVNGIDVHFYNDSFVVKSIVGYTNSAVCSIAINKKGLTKSEKLF